MITQQSTREEIQRLIDGGGEVVFAPGLYQDACYRITRPVHLRGEGAVLVGGKKINWVEEDGLLVCSVSSDLPIRVLVVGGALRARCRLPETGYLQHLSEFDVKWMSTTGGGWQRKPTHEELTTLRAQPGFLKDLTLDSAEASVIHSWDESLLTVKSVQGDVITFAQMGGHPAGGFDVHDYCLWNVPEAFKEEGTFYHDTRAGKLYYRPLPGESVQTEAFLPTAQSIFYTEAPVSGVEIEGFTLMATDTPRVCGGFGAYAMPGAIDFGDISGSAFHHLTIKAVGGYGIRTTGQVSGVSIHHCDISMTGAGGLRVGSNNAQGMTPTEITDCCVHHVGKYYPSAIGIATTNCHIRHNEVCHTSYSAINCSGNDFIVEKNLLHDAMEVLNDGAAIYSFGSHRGVMRGNLAYGIHPRNGHKLRIAYYLDEVSKDWLVEGNVAIDCDFPNHNHMCGDHTYQGNLFVNEGAGLLITMHNPASGNRYIGNVLSAGGQIVFSMPDLGIKEFSGNYYHAQGGALTQDILDKYEKIGERVYAASASNTPIDALHFTPDQRLFSAPGLEIDLSDVGPRG